jgi:DNA recombination protein RmuC
MVLNALENAGLGPDRPSLWIVVALLVAPTISSAYARRRARAANIYRGELERARIALAGAETRASEVEPLKASLASERAERARLEQEAAARSARFAEREAALEELKRRMEIDFQAAASKMLEDTHKAFLLRANETFEKHREAAGADAETKRRAIDELIKPMRETLVRYESGLAELRAEQQKARGELSGQLGELTKSTHDVRLEAQKLATALRAGPKTRGRWGEEQLRNVVEIAGMAAYVDFVEQPSHSDGEKRKQPDMVVRLPGGRVIAVDSKVSLGAYLDAVEAATEEERTACLARHADDLWSHVKALSAKEYAATLRDALDYVVMFVPGENYFSAAMEARPQLYQDAFDRRILIATPTILIAMLKSAALNWRQEKMTKNAQAVAAMAKDLYDSLRRMGENLSRLGGSIENAVRRYNEVVANVEGRVLPRARKFADYELPGVETEIEELPLVEATTRALRDDRLKDDAEGDAPAAA